jgi:type II secretory pathway pseudopilin PulG
MELMIVVAIIGILAAVAIPVYLNYAKKAKASEAFIVLQGIREKEEAYHADYDRYSDSIPWTPYSPGGGTCSHTHDWTNVDAAWGTLKFYPSGPTYYTYSVTSGTPGGTRVAFPSDPPGTRWPGFLEDWYTATAQGDADCDGKNAFFHISSHSNVVVKTDSANNVDEDVY